MGAEGALEGLPRAIAAAEKLPSPPTVAVEVLRLAQDESTTIQDLAQVLARDPALSARLMKLANSSLFRRGDPVSSLDQATMRLGMKTVKLMALGFSLASDLPRKGDARGFDYFGYWRRSLTMAVAARALARMVKSPQSDEAFLCGLLGRLGQLVMAQCLRETYEAVIERAEGELPDAALERQILDFDFHRVGAELLRHWELPELIWRTVAGWGDPEAAAGTPEAPLMRILHLADHVAQVLCQSRKGAALESLYALGASYLGVSEQELDACILGLEEDATEMASMLNVDLDQASYAEILERARAEMVQLSLGTALDLEATSSRAAELERRNRELETRAQTDPLTGIPNRAHFDETLERVVRARLAGESRNELGILMLDVDHFKNFNDTHGHSVGDRVLKEVARSLVEATRDTDIAARYGGEEFVVVVPNTTLEDLRGVAERLRRRVEAIRLPHDGDLLSVTISVGGACVRRVRSLEDGPALLSLADTCLYEAKHAGRNRSVCREVEQARR